MYGISYIYDGSVHVIEVYIGFYGHMQSLLIYNFYHAFTGWWIKMTK